MQKNMVQSNAIGHAPQAEGASLREDSIGVAPPIQYTYLARNERTGDGTEGQSPQENRLENRNLSFAALRAQAITIELDTRLESLPRQEIRAHWYNITLIMRETRVSGLDLRDASDVLISEVFTQTWRVLSIHLDWWDDRLTLERRVRKKSWQYFRGGLLGGIGYNRLECFLNRLYLLSDYDLVCTKPELIELIKTVSELNWRAE